MGIINFGTDLGINTSYVSSTSATRHTNPGLASYTAIQERSQVTLPLAKLHMRVDGDIEDELIQFYINAACQRADTYCQNLFLAGDGRTKLAIPSDVDVWVLLCVGKFYNSRVLGEQKVQIQDLGTVVYAKLDNIDVNMDLLKSYRKEPGFGSLT